MKLIRALSLKMRIILILFSISALPIVSFIILIQYNTYLTGDPAYFLKESAAVIALVGIFLFCASALYANKAVALILNQIKKGMMEVEAGNFDKKIELSGMNEFGEIIDAYDRMTDKLKVDKRELELQSLEIYAKNIEIQQANMELEASYGQLQATINQLNDSEQKYSSLVKNIADIVCVIRLDGNIYFINEIVRDILGYTRQEVEGHSIKQILKPGITENFLERISNELKIKNLLTIELELVHKNGSAILTEATLTNFVYDGEVMGVQAIIRDITQKKKMEQEIISSYKEVATINSLSRKLNASLDIGNVLDMAVHEICNVFKAPFCVLRIIDDEGKYLIPKAYAGEYLEDIGKDPMDFLPLRVEDPIFAEPFNSADIAILHDFSFSEIVCRINETKEQDYKIKELLMAFIKTKEKKVGILTVGSVSKFNYRQKSFLSSIANNAAIAIENARLFDATKKNFIKTVNALIAAIEAKDNYTRGHSCRVSEIAVVIAEKMGLTRDKIDEVRIAGILHDVGKIGVPDAILRKPGRLTDEEFEQIKMHPSISNKILEPVGLSEDALQAIISHHERWDGKGYPRGINKEQLSIEAQIISVADALDAMTSTRAYRGAMAKEDAVNEILRCKNSQFNPEVVEALSEAFKTNGRDILDEAVDQ